MRKDAVGFFWQTPQKVKPTAPEPTWLLPTYLPGLEEARAFPVPTMTEEELVQAFHARDVLVVDTEIYPNYFLAAFRSESTGKVHYLEMVQGGSLNTAKLKWICENFLLVSFNGIAFDMPILSLACNGAECGRLKQATNLLINDGKRASDVLRVFRTTALKADHIDLIEVAPLDGSLKIYSGRLHAPKMQDLPFPPETSLSGDQISIVRYYCCNDLSSTSLLYNALKKDIDLRIHLSEEYKIDLRSKSDAQIAEKVIVSQVDTLNRFRSQRPEVEVGKVHHYQVPSWISYKTELLNSVLRIVRESRFVVSEKGGVELPDSVKDLCFTINQSTYTMGIGGLHSTEKSCFHKSDAEYVLIDRDVASYYPSIILNQNLFPKHLGLNFITVYRTLVTKRLAAKAAKQSRIAGSLKITINGGFGKLGSKWSMLYSPELLIQVTITGQLALLMLIEAIELAGTSVVSANTDGIVIKCPRDREGELGEIIAAWESQTNFVTEETRYKAVYSRDVNNYIAVKENDKTKGKGIFANPWLAGDLTECLHKNPSNTICVEAVTAFLVHGTAIAETVSNCRDITKFACIQRVAGGAVKDGIYLGKAIRWYYSTNSPGPIVYAKNGNKVPSSDGAKPCMEYPKEFPEDVDRCWYVTEAFNMLRDLGIK